RRRGDHRPDLRRARPRTCRRVRLSNRRRAVPERPGRRAAGHPAAPARRSVPHPRRRGRGRPGHAREGDLRGAGQHLGLDRPPRPSSGHGVRARHRRASGAAAPAVRVRAGRVRDRRAALRRAVGPLVPRRHAGPVLPLPRGGRRRAAAGGGHPQGRRVRRGREAAAMTALELARMRLSEERDVFALRRLGRAVAELAGLEAQDQIRVATALSEVGREVVAAGALVLFVLDAGERRVTVAHTARVTDSEGLARAARLVDGVVPEEGRVTITKRLTGAALQLRAGQVRERLARMAPVSAMDELRHQNQELAATLEHVLRLNAELQETNQGVMALYNELSTELEETNRGVVALYAELDEKSSQLREAAEARKRFWATVSHELRSPLNSIIGLVRLLTGPGGDPLT